MRRPWAVVAVGMAIAVVALLAWPTQPFGSASWEVTVGSNDAGFVTVSSGGRRLGVAALLGDPLSTADRIRLGTAGFLALALVVAWISSARSPEED